MSPEVQTLSADAPPADFSQLFGGLMQNIEKQRANEEAAETLSDAPRKKERRRRERPPFNMRAYIEKHNDVFGVELPEVGLAPKDGEFHLSGCPLDDSPADTGLDQVLLKVPEYGAPQFICMRHNACADKTIKHVWRKYPPDWPEEPTRHSEYFLSGNLIKKRGGKDAKGNIKDPITVCGGRLEVIGKARTEHGTDVSTVLRWVDIDERERLWVAPDSDLHTGDKVIQYLASRGLTLFAGEGNNMRLREYVSKLAACTWSRYIAVKHTGWHGRYFVLPDGIVIPSQSANEEPLLFADEGIEETHLYREKGTLEGWINGVVKPLAGNTVPVLTMSAAFAGPVLHFIDSESIGLHLHGTSSKGKSTSSLCASSLYGGGGKEGFMSSWHGTQVGIETEAAAHSDAALFLEEIGRADARRILSVIYMLAENAGKGRGTKEVTARRKLTWRLVFISTGEKTVAQMLRDKDPKAKPPGGVDLRLLHIAISPENNGAFDDIHGVESSGAFSEQLQNASRENYGVGLRPWLRWLSENIVKVRHWVKQAQEKFIASYVPSEASGEVRRAANRFAIFAAAGELATAAGLTGWQPGEASRCVKVEFQKWLQARGGIQAADKQNGVELVRDFIFENRDRFQHLSGRTGEGREHIVHNLAGWRAPNDTEFLFTPDGFKKACGDLDSKVVVTELVNQGFMRRREVRENDKHNPFMNQVTVEALSKRMWLYVVSGGILGEHDESGAAQPPKAAGAGEEPPF